VKNYFSKVYPTSFFTFHFSFFTILGTFVPEFASLAQLVEQLTRNEQVGGSSPLRGSSILHCAFFISHFAGYT
jgi:hypothetical protein